MKKNNETTEKNYIYDEVNGNHYPLALFVDTDDRMIHEVQRNKSGKFKKHSFLHGKEDALTYTRGFYTVGRRIVDQALEYIRKQIETMDRLDEFVITSSISGGTGSGFCCWLVDELDWNGGYSKVRKNGFIIFPSSKVANNVLGIYNTVLAMPNMIGYFDSITMFDNQSMYNFIDHQLDVDFVDYSFLNNLVAQIISSYTGIRRFNQEDNSAFFSNLCPSPKLHFYIPSYGKLTLINDYVRKELEQREFIQFLKKIDQKLYQCSNNPHYICSTLLLRKRQFNPFSGRLDQTINNLNNQFGQTSQIYQCKSSNYQVLPELAEMKQTGTLFSNDASIASSLKALEKRFSYAYDQHAFIGGFEGWKSRDIYIARDDLKQLQHEYEEFFTVDNQEI
ncbi:unnamed protein product [Paramecium octaurelia]|uniref:Tubulin/FtsZ GTPase domain-containing protein n=1 Tax=Paramecium octaurelia TaxID=43137 RepID=A0A8S1W8J6_PAROT|nr:unnamed protein product [Paramecium octaurelia]